MQRSLGSRFKRGSLLLLPLLVLFLLGKKIFLFVSGLAKNMPGPQTTDFLLGTLLLTLLIIFLDKVFEWISRTKIFTRKRGGKKVPLVGIYQRIMEDKEAFPEVGFLDGRRLRKGIRMSSKYSIRVNEGEEEVFNILEPRPGSAGGRMCQIKEQDFWYTGRNGAETIAEITLGYGIH